jgi:hypothetical protein
MNRTTDAVIDDRNKGRALKEYARNMLLDMYCRLFPYRRFIMREWWPIKLRRN